MSQDVQEYFQEFSRKWPKNGTYYIWGAANTAKELCAIFADEIHVEGFIDSDPRKHGTQFLGRPVLTPEQFYSRQDHVQCIVASLAYSEIDQALRQHGLKENVDFCQSYRFTGIHQYLDKEQLAFLRTNVIITAYCSLRCRHCCMSVPYYKHRQHRSAEAVLSDVDTYFQWVDHVRRFDLMGGEPFIHPDVDEITERIAERYRSRIDELMFITNGTIIPSKRMRNLMKRYQLKVEISDYHKGAPQIQPMVESLIQVLQDQGISHVLTPNDTWIDWNDIPEDRTDWSAKKMAAYCKNCGTCCQGIYDQRFYYCCQQIGAGLADICSDEPGDYFDMIRPVNAERRGELLAFYLDCAPKGYESYCRKCAGWRAVNPRIVPAGEQLPPT